MFIGLSSMKIRYVDKYMQVSDQTVFSLFAFSTLIHYNEHTFKELQKNLFQFNAKCIEMCVGKIATSFFHN